MPRVLLVSAAARLGGAERSLVELARAIDRSRFELAAVVAGRGGLADAFTSSGIGVHVVAMERITRTSHARALAEMAASVVKASRRIAAIIREHRVDLVHSNGVASHVYASEGARAVRRAHDARVLSLSKGARAAGVPCVWHARDMVGPGPAAGRLFSGAARIVAVSRAVRDHLVESGAPAELVRVIPNGLDLSAFKDPTPRDEARRELGLGARAFVAGSAGVFVPWKRHEDFVRAFAKLCEHAETSTSATEDTEHTEGGNHSVTSVSSVASRVRGVLFGDDLFGDNARYSSELKDLARELVGDRLVLAGWRDDMPRVLPALDVFVSASENEPFGRVIVEAMAAGLPVVATDSGGKREIVEDGVTGVLVPHGDIDALARALDELRRDPERRAAMGEAGRRVALERFTVDRAAREVEVVWDELAGGHSS